MSVQQSQSVYQIKITLRDIKPPIWRRFLVPADIQLSRFHIVLQIVMGWTNSHLHQFASESTFYGTPDDDFGMEIEDETRYRLSDVLKKEKDTLIYEYDFGDSWEHKIVLEKVLPSDANVELPSCIKGKRACPPEDCGGVWGYQDIIEAFRSPSNPDHDEVLEWVGEDFDPEAFSLDETNYDLAKYWNKPKDNRDIYIM